MPEKRLRDDQRIMIMYIIDTCIAPPGRPQRGGAEKQLLLLAASLNKDLFRPIIVQLITAPMTSVSIGKIDDVEFIHLPTERFYSLSGLRQIARLSSMARGKSVSIIHTFFEKAEVMGWLAKRLSGVPIWVTSRRDLGFKRKKVYDRIFKLASKDCTSCIANCQAIKCQVIEKENIDPDKVGVIYNGLDTAPFEHSLNGAAFRKEIGVDSNTPLIGMVANLNFEIKGHQYFIEAAKRVQVKISKAQFVLVGDGQLRSRYEEMVRSLGMQGSVHFLGKRDDVAEILSQLDVSVLCSTSEGFSNVILESMAAGKPVVATNIGGNSEMVVAGVTGYLVPPADSGSLAEAVASLLNDPDMRRRMGENAKKQVADLFSIPAMVEGYEHLYRSLVTELLISKASPRGVDQEGRTDRVV
ncbi:Glycosyltransferase, WbnK-like family [Candidatus Sulfobium mesophilum]|uniref:Glycosyltransferase, WbnK-like family n=1 Tax=Candidatus Sulfobium mesophilum TaxID=2016548 RepID=A0A2U3QDP0_9BACT|nr:Glycosyltransferase, WbnK-like family [Candidatus Sulfobium mesophilum]